MNDTVTRQDIVEFLLEQIAERIPAPSQGFDLDADLVEMGVKSIDAVLVSGEIEDRFGAEIEPVLLFECRTINRVADSVLETVRAG